MGTRSAAHRCRHDPARWRRAGAAGVTAGLLVLALVGCEPDAGDIYSPEAWRKLFEDNGWVPLPFPESKYVPGTIVKIDPKADPENGIRYVDHLKSCGYPAEVLAPEVGKIPAISFTKAREIGADALLNIQGIEAGPEFEKVARARLTVSDHSADALRLIALQIYEETHPDGAWRTCKAALQKPGYYLINEAFRVSKGRYTLYDQSGGKLKLNVAELGRLIKFAPDVSYQVTGEGELEIASPVTFAVRRAVSTMAGFDVLGTPGAAETGDAAIDALYRKANAAD